MDAVDALHEIQQVLLYRIRLTVNSRTVTLQRLALPDQWKIKVTVNHLFTIRKAALVSALSRKDSQG